MCQTCLFVEPMHKLKIDEILLHCSNLKNGFIEMPEIV